MTDLQIVPFRNKSKSAVHTFEHTTQIRVGARSLEQCCEMAPQFCMAYGVQLKAGLEFPKI